MNKNKNNDPFEDKVVFLNVDQEKQQIKKPLILLIILSLTILSVFWKSFVRQPGNQQTAITEQINRLKEEKKKIRQPKKETLQKPKAPQ